MKAQLLLQQTTDAYAWTKKLLYSIPYEKWETLPPVLETNVLWQAGHLLVSFYYHSILVISGHQPDILQTIPLRLYGQLFTQAAPVESINKVNPKQLFSDLTAMQEHSLNSIAKIAEEELEAALEPTGYPHPVAKTRFEALDWNINHTFWHCGQIGLIKRVVDQRYEFGLKAK